MDPATIAAVAGLIVGLVDTLNEAVQSGNRKKAANIRQQVSNVLSKYNLKANQLRSALETKGLEYNKFREAMNYSSPSSKGRQILDDLNREYSDQVKETNDQINKLQHQAEVYQAHKENEAARLESKNILGDMIGGIQDIGSILKNTLIN